MVDLILIGILIVMTLWKFEPGRVEDGKPLNLLERDASTALKGLSAFFVIAAHTHAWLEGSVSICPWSKFADIILTQLGGMGVLIFFFLSGYGIQEGYGKRSIDRSYIIKRIKNVWLPYVELKIFFLAVETVIGVLTFNDIPQRLWGIITMEDWFIFVIVIEYIFYYVARKIMAKYYILALVGMNLVLAVVFIIQQRADRYINSMWLFLFGIILSIYKGMFIRLLRERYYEVAIASGALFLMMGAVFAINKGALWADFVKPISGMALCILLICIMLKSHINSPFLKWGGQRSLYLYIVHIWVFGILQGKIINLAVLLMMFVIMTVVITEVFYRIMMR